MKHKKTGKFTVFLKGLVGEFRAERFLRKKGMKPVARRYRAAHGEVDLIMRDRDTLVFIEVKYRPNGLPGSGLLAVDADKMRRVRQAAESYLRKHPADLVRFDAVEITRSGARHLPNAF